MTLFQFQNTKTTNTSSDYRWSSSRIFHKCLIAWNTVRKLIYYYTEQTSTWGPPPVLCVKRWLFSPAPLPLLFQLLCTILLSCVCICALGKSCRPACCDAPRPKLSSHRIRHSGSLCCHRGSGWPISEPTLHHRLDHLSGCGRR